MSKDLLMTPEEFLKSGIHIGTRYKTNGMKQYIFSIRRDGLKVLAIETINDKIKEAAALIAKYDSDKVAVIGRRIFAQTPIKKFCDAIGAKSYTGRFVPGTFTNTNAKRFFEPRLILLTESNLDFQAINEAKSLKIPVIAFSSTNNFTEGVDLVVPSNNKGRKSLAVLFYLLAREVQLLKGVIKTRQEFAHKVDDFEYKGKEKHSDAQNGKKTMRRGNNNNTQRRPFRRNNDGDSDSGDRPQRFSRY